MAKSKKGSGFEREFCKQLSLWWSFNRGDDYFWRTSNSGGRATVRMKQKLKTADSYGDVGAIRVEGKPLTESTFIELKRGYTGKKGKKNIRWISITDLIDANKDIKSEPILVKWWKEAREKCKESGRTRTFVIFKRDRRMACIIMSRKTFKFLEKKNGLLTCPPYYAWAWINLKSISDIMIIRIEDFFKWCDPKTLGAKRKIKRR